MHDNISTALITAFEQHYDTRWDDAQLRNERLAWRAAWNAAQAAPVTPQGEWRIDTSAGREILVYKNCSVIEDADARYVLSLIAAASQPAAAAAPTLDVTLDEDQAGLLRDMLGDPAEYEDALTVRLIVCDGRSGHGLYVAQAEYQDEGAVLLASLPAPAAPALEAPAVPAPAVPDGWRLVPIEFLRGFGTLAHNYSLTAIAPDHYWGNERSAFSDAYARCGQDLTKLRDMLSAEAPPLAAAPQAPAAPVTPAAAMAALKAAFAADPEYAWSWHCGAWACAHDEGLDTGAANRAAARLMHMAFGCDTSKHPNFLDEHRTAAPAAPAVDATSDTALLDAMQRHRIALVPEFEGPWDAEIFNDEAEAHPIASGNTPREALRAAIAAQAKEGGAA
jgi:hypothetical protein